MPPSRASIENYYNLVLSGQLRRNRDQIMAWILDHHRGRIVTAHVISQHTGIPIQSVCKPIKNLADDGFIQRSPCTIPDPITGNPAHRITPTLPQPAQRGFTWSEA